MTKRYLSADEQAQYDADQRAKKTHPALHPMIDRKVSIRHTRGKYAGEIRFAGARDARFFFNNHEERDSICAFLNRAHATVEQSYPGVDPENVYRHPDKYTQRVEDRTQLQYAEGEGYTVKFDPPEMTKADRMRSHIADLERQEREPERGKGQTLSEAAKRAYEATLTEDDRQKLHDPRLTDERVRAINHAAMAFMQAHLFSPSARARHEALSRLKAVSNLDTGDKAIAVYTREVSEVEAAKNQALAAAREAKQAARVQQWAVEDNAESAQVELVQAYTPPTPAREAPAPTGLKARVWRYGSDESTIEDLPPGTQP